MLIRISSALRKIFLTCLTIALLYRPAVAQESGIPARIVEAINETKLTVLKGNTHPLARKEFDRGPATSNLQLNRMLLLLESGPAQAASLKSLLDQQQDKSSPNYHRWLTPQQFGQRFGNSDQDIRTITSWLTSHGFQVNNVAKGRRVIEFSGTAGQVKQAFHTEIHKFEVNGKEYWANSTEPELPTALAPGVAGIVSLNSFPRKPLYRIVGVFSRAKNSGQHEFLRSPSTERPLFTFGGACGLTGSSPCYGVGPSDFATIYNVLPLWNAASPIDGTGQTIAIVSQSDIYPQDFNNFRSNFGLPPGTLNIINNGTDPGKLATQGDELESDLDVEWAGAVAKGATIDFVVSASTNTTAGVDLSALYAVDNDLAPVMSDSYGACELDMGTAGNQFYNQLWEQAAAEGITVFVSTGDSGSAVCDRDEPIATQGLAVNGISSTPYDIAVGGTDFNDLQDASLYWSSINNPVTYASALSYIPETSWNDSCTNSEFFPFTGETNAESDCNDRSSNYSPGFLVPVGGSGGASNCITSTGQAVASCAGGYAKPSWQSGPGVPDDGSRDVPDVSLFAGDGLNASFYAVCETDLYGVCADGVYSGIVAVGGTSASAPAFAGIMAMVNQKTQSRQGDANYVLYPLAAQAGTSCNASGTISSSCIFYDVTSGTIAMPCLTGSPDCVTNVSGDQNGVLSGYSTNAGYDLATGLGSVNVANLVNNWGSVSFQPTVASLSLSPTTQITHGSPVNLNVIVAPSTGAGTPTGLVSLLTSAGPTAGTFTLAGGAVSTTTGLLPGGSYSVTAHYSGDGTYAASDSSPGIPVTVNPEPSTTTVQAFTLSSNGVATPFTNGPYGLNGVFLSASVAGKSGEGVPTGVVDFTQTLNGMTTNLAGDPYALNSEAYTMTPLGNPTFFSPGTYTMAAKYGGDPSFNASTSSPVNFTVTQAETGVTTQIDLCSSASGECILSPGTYISVSATVGCSRSPFSTPPSGTMTFYSNGTQLGSVAVDAGIAGFSTNQLPVGLDNFTAQYSGDTNYAGSTSVATPIDIGGTFAITASPSTLNIASPGQSASTTLTFVAQNGLVGSAALLPSTCSSLPPKTSCSFSPSTVTFTSSSTTVPVTLTITTTASSAAVLNPAGRPLSAQWLFSGGIAYIGIVGICVVPLGVRRRLWSSMFGLIGLALVASVTGKPPTLH